MSTTPIRVQAFDRMMAEKAFRDRNPECGAVTAYGMHTGSVVNANGEDEIAFVAFARTGMNLVETGVQPVVRDGDGVKLGKVRDYTEAPLPGREAEWVEYQGIRRLVERVAG